jgi:lipoprotein-releasing system permease protein
VSILGISIGAAALVLVLSVFNGFEDLIIGMLSRFNPDVKITAKVGKTFDYDSSQVAKLKEVPGVLGVSGTMEEVAFFEYGDSQDFGVLKGVDKNYDLVTGIDSTIFEGRYQLKDSERNYAILGGQMRNKLLVDVESPFDLLNIYMAKRGKIKNLEQPFRKRFVHPIGSFRIQQDIDAQYILVDLALAQELTGSYDKVSALEVRLNPNMDADEIISDMEKLMGNDFDVKDRYRQDESFLKLMNIEKWMSFIILSLTLVLVAFNLIGSLWMIVLEKKRDISILKSMGATDLTIRNIFLNEGLLICGIGLGAGFLIAFLLYGAQKMFGIVPIPDGFVVDAYPISMRVGDLLAVAAVVIVIGLLASIPAALRAKRVPALVLEE